MNATDIKALADRLRMHASDCFKAADPDTDVVLIPVQLDDLSKALEEAAAALSTPQARPDGGAVDEVLLACPRCGTESYATPHESLYRHPAPAPDVARLVEAAEAFPEEPNPYTYRIARAKLREALAPFIAAQEQEATNGQE